MEDCSRMFGVAQCAYGGANRLASDGGPGCESRAQGSSHPPASLQRSATHAFLAAPIAGNPDVGMDTCSTSVDQVESNGFHSFAPGDTQVWVRIHDWIKGLDEMLNDNTPAELRLYVTDDSAADCMTRKGA